MRVVALIPARRNSKGVPFKNRQEIAGKSLVMHAVEFALECGFDDVVLSTDDEYFDALLPNGVERHHRPEGLAGDKTIISDVLIDFCQEPRWHNVFLVVLEPTCFFRRTTHLSFLFEGKSFDIKKDHFASFSPAPVVREKIWNFDRQQHTMKAQGDVWKRRQDYCPQYVLSGHYYGLPAPMLKNIYPALCDDSVYPLIIDEPQVDINTELDLQLAKFLIGEGYGASQR